MRPIPKTLAIAAVALLFGAAAVEAAAADARSGRFRVTLEGVQRTTWSTDHVAQFECDVNIHGGGSETVRFRSRPAVVTVRAYGRLALLTRGRRPATLDLAARISRRGEVATSGSPLCADGDGGGGAPPAPDCGQRRSRMFVDVAYLAGRRWLIGLDANKLPPLSPFRACPVGGIAWPELLDRTSSGRPIGRILPVRDLFAHGKSIVIGRGRDVQEADGSRSTTTIRWELALTRLGGRRPR